MSISIAVSLPGLLRDAIGESSVNVVADDLAGAMSQLRRHAKLGPMIFDERGELRPHVLVFHNDIATRHLESLAVKLRPGDTIAVVQAVSGG